MNPLIKEAIDNHVNHGWSGGSFVDAMLSNDLMDAIGRADSQSIMDLLEIARYIYNEIPRGCHGSRKIVQAWRDRFNPDGTLK